MDENNNSIIEKLSNLSLVSIEDQRDKIAENVILQELYKDGKINIDLLVRHINNLYKEIEKTDLKSFGQNDQNIFTQSLLDEIKNLKEANSALSSRLELCYNSMNDYKLWKKIIDIKVMDNEQSVNEIREQIITGDVITIVEPIKKIEESNHKCDIRLNVLETELKKGLSRLDSTLAEISQQFDVLRNDGINCDKDLRQRIAALSNEIETVKASGVEVIRNLGVAAKNNESRMADVVNLERNVSAIVRDKIDPLILGMDQVDQIKNNVNIICREMKHEVAALKSDVCTQQKDLAKRIQDINTVSAALNGRLTVAEQSLVNCNATINRVISFINDDLTDRFSAMDDEIKSIKALEMATLQRIIDDELPSLLQKIERLEAAVPDGSDEAWSGAPSDVFVWSVHCVSGRLRTRPTSPSFYGGAGYRIQLQMRAMHDRIHVVVRLLVGRNDAHLEWPCHVTVFVKIVDQEQRGRDFHGQYTFDGECRKDGYPTVFRGPIHLFHANDLVSSKRYLSIDDRLIVHCFADQ